MKQRRDNEKCGMGCALLVLALFSSLSHAEEINYADLPLSAQIDNALNNHLLVRNATNELNIERTNQRKWNSGNYEFNVRAGTGQRSVTSTGEKLKEWDVGVERPLRWLNKVGIDEDIGAASVARAEYALGDARHEAGRTLLQMWFTWQREQAQVTLWQQQADILKRQAQLVEKRVKAGDAPKLELNLALAASAQASVPLHQAQLRTQLASNALKKQFPAIQLPEQVLLAMPQMIDHDLAYWKAIVLEHNHELGVVQQQNLVQQLLVQRSRADQLPDPTVGVRYAKEASGNEKVAGVYVSVPLPSVSRRATADSAIQQAAIAADQEAFAKRRLEGEIYATHTQAVSNYSTWQQAHEAAQAIRSNAELTAKAYSLGENSLLDNLTARRFALESSLAESLAQLDANEARYRLLLDAHQLWSLGNDADEHHANHY
ncbi:MAG: TolC family protein [Gallionella sp.]